MSKADELDNLIRKMESGTDVLGFHAPVIGMATVLWPRAITCPFWKLAERLL